MEPSSFSRKMVAESAFHTARSDGWFELADTASCEKPPNSFSTPVRSRPVGPVAQPGRAPEEQHHCSGEAFSLQKDTRLSRVQFPAGPPTIGSIWPSLFR